MLVPALALLAALLQLQLQSTSASPTAWFEEPAWTAQVSLSGTQLIQDTKTFVKVSWTAILPGVLFCVFY